MTTTVDALKALYTALGGELTDTYDDIASGATVGNYNVIPDVVNAIANHVASGGAAELPAVTDEDDGKVLKVVDGAWAVGEDATT